jgi:hypothetical protein
MLYSLPDEMLTLSRCVRIDSANYSTRNSMNIKVRVLYRRTMLANSKFPTNGEGLDSPKL